MTSRLFARFVALVVSALVAGACAISTDGNPRDISEDARRPIVQADRSAGDAIGDARIYLVTSNEATGRRILRSAARSAETPGGVLRALLEGPNDEEQRDGMTTILPEGLTLTATPTYPGDELVIEVSSELTDVEGEAQIFAVAQIVATATELPDVRSVRLRLENDENDDEPHRWPTADRELVDRPLTIYDYLDLLDTAQPDYPAVPSEPAPGGVGTTSLRSSEEQFGHL